jgi:dienelactone hydrolase
MLRLSLILATGILIMPAKVQAQPNTKKGNEIIEKYLADETDRLSKKVFDGAASVDEWKKKRPRLYQEYMDMLGLWPIPEKTPLKVTITKTFEHEGVVIDNLHYQSKPGLYVTANLYRPKNPPEKKLPAVLYVCGHSGRGRDGNKSAFQDHGMWFASNGYVCMVLDTLQLGEIAGIHHGTYNKDRWWWHATGYSPAGVEAWNGIRGIDYLVSRPDVDGERIAVTGISGGGAVTFWIAAADDRVKVAVPVSGMSDLESYVKNKVVNGHCDCMFVYNTYQWDWTTIAALVAPRPMLFANSDNDKIFPMDGNRRIIEKLRKLYKMYGKDDLVDEYVSEGGHAYRPDLRVAIFKFINKHIKNDTSTPVKDAEFKELPGSMLRVFPTDEDLPKDRINEKVDETFIRLAKVKLPEAGKYQEWREGLLKKLKEKSFRPIPETIPIGKGHRFSVGVSVKTANRHAFIPLNKVDDTSPLLIFLDTSFNVPEKRAEPLVKENGKHELVFVIPIGQNPFTWSWTKKSPPNYVERSHVLLGHTTDEGKILDFLESVRYLQKEWGLKEIRIGGYGRDGILAAYAALLDPSITEVIIVDPPKSHKEGPYFLNVLQVLDIPDALGMLAPRKLTLINANDPAFDRVERIYKLAGAADKLTRK